MVTCKGRARLCILFHHAFCKRKDGGDKIMLLNCTRQASKLVHLDNCLRSIFASFTSGSVFTSFRLSDLKRAVVRHYNRTPLAWTAKKMDASSIITQVSRDQDQYNGYHPSLPDDGKGNCTFKCYQFC